MMSSLNLIATGLSLAAAPTFAAMAFLTHVSSGGSQPLHGATDGFALGGMVPMYLLMSAFHLSPWLKLAVGVPS